MPLPQQGKRPASKQSCLQRQIQMCRQSQAAFQAPQHGRCYGHRQVPATHVKQVRRTCTQSTGKTRLHPNTRHPQAPCEAALLPQAAAAAPTAPWLHPLPFHCITIVAVRCLDIGASATAGTALLVLPHASAMRGPAVVTGRSGAAASDLARCASGASPYVVVRCLGTRPAPLMSATISCGDSSCARGRYGHARSASPQLAATKSATRSRSRLDLTRAYYDQ